MELGVAATGCGQWAREAGSGGGDLLDRDPGAPGDAGDPRVPPAGHLLHTLGQRGQRRIEDPHRVRAGVLGAAHQFRGQRDAGLGPVRDVRAQRERTGVGVRGAVLGGPVDLDIGGVPIDRHLAQQRGPPHHRHSGHPPGVDRPPRDGQPRQVLAGEPFRVARPRRQRRRGHRLEDLTGRIRPAPAQTQPGSSSSSSWRHEVLASQLRARHRHQHHAGRQATITLLDPPQTKSPLIGMWTRA